MGPCFPYPDVFSCQFAKEIFVTCLENGDMGAMSVESLRRYIAALGGSLTLVADLPSGKVRLA